MRWALFILTLAIAILVVIPQTAFASGNSDSDQTSALAVLSKSRILPLGRFSGERSGRHAVPPCRRYRRESETWSSRAGRTHSAAGARAAIPRFDRVERSTVFTCSPNDDVIVGHGATLLIEGRTVHEVRFRSMPAPFNTITAWRGAITVAGTQNPARRHHLLESERERSRPGRSGWPSLGTDESRDHGPDLGEHGVPRIHHWHPVWCRLEGLPR